MKTAKERFKKGDRVEMTKSGRDWLDSKPTLGTVVGFCKSPFSVGVVKDGQVTRYNYHVDFWAISSKESNEQTN